MSDSLCIYCGENQATTDDHIPGASFFPRPRPSNLITVPSCDSCNKGFQKDEELFLATFMFGDAGVSEAGRHLWNEKLHRMYTRNKGLRRRIAKNLRPVDIRLPSGVYLREGWGIQLEHARLLNVVEKAVRGLYYFEFNERLPTNLEIISHFVRSDTEMSPIMPVTDQLRFGARQWEAIFEYRFNRVAERPDASIWLLKFYGCHVFWSATKGIDEPTT